MNTYASLILPIKSIIFEAIHANNYSRIRGIKIPEMSSVTAKQNDWEDQMNKIEKYTRSFELSLLNIPITI